MLSELRIRNFAIIDELQVSFGEGLNIISGETGAGKSIIIGAISMLLGDRASVDMIRSSEETATIEASFHIADKDYLSKKLREMGCYDSDELIVKRIISRSGKNKVYINGNIANLSILSSICELLINICGQHEHQLILNKDSHIEILDDFGGLRELRQSYELLYEKYLTVRLKLKELDQRRVRNKEDNELHLFQLQEINDADIKENEEYSLLEEKKFIMNAQKLHEYSEGAYEKLYGKKGSILEELRHVMAEIREIKKIDEKITLNELTFENIYYQLEDIALVLRNYGKGLSYDQRRLDTVDERLELIRRMKRKYGGSWDAVQQKKIDLENSLNVMSEIEEEIEHVLRTIEETKSALAEKANILSRKRREAASNLEASIESEIQTLKMSKAVFTVKFSQHSNQDGDSFHLTGIDDMEFYLSTNAGEELKPLARIASGGELSRIILALKKVLAGTGQVGTIIFDEVDSGIGGGTAEIVGEKLKEVAEKYQVLCITHLPQIACFATRHFRVSKEERGEHTNTTINLLSEEERLDEITRMLTGIEITEKARNHAREMLDYSRLHQ